MAYKYDFSLTQTTSNYDLSIFEHDEVITLCSFINKEYPFYVLQNDILQRTQYSIYL